MDRSAGRGFGVACLLLALAYYAVLQWILPHEFFKTDDFVFLSEVQDPAWSWAHAFFPVDTWSYWNVRPLGVDAYFRIGWGLFGLDPGAFFQVNLLVHFALAPVVYRIARQLGLAPVLALAAALLAISRPASLVVLFHGAGFSSLLAQLLAALSLSLFLDHLRGRGRRRLGGSLGALSLALLSHESVLLLPAVLAAAAARDRGLRPLGSSLLRISRDVGLHAALVVGYLIVRFTWIAPLRNDGPYARNWAPAHFIKSALIQLGMLVEGVLPFLLLLLAIAGLLALAACLRSGRRLLREQILPTGLVLLVWISAFLGPITLLPNPHRRFSHYVVAPAALGIALLLQLACTIMPSRLRRPGLVLLLSGLLLAVPWRSLSDRRQDDSWLFPRDFLEVVERHYAPLPRRVRFVLVYGHEGLAGEREKSRFVSRTVGGAPLVRAAYYELEPSMRFLHVGEQPRWGMLCDPCLYLALRPDLRVQPLEPEALTELVLSPALAGDDEKARNAAARQLVRRRGPEALPVLETACRGRADVESCRSAILEVVGDSRAGAAAEVLAGLRGAWGE